MFFTDDLLTKKKGAFGIVWLAATLGPRAKRITKNELTNVNVARTCELIAEPPEPLALRLSGALLVGVARVYDRNYQIFYSDVHNFHTVLRKSLTSEGRAVFGTQATVDLDGDGKSRFENITFTGTDAAIQSGFALEFEYINWHDPLGTRKRRRATSKLDSLPSHLEEEEVGDEEEYEDETEDGSLLPVGRGKRNRVGSSPFLANLPLRKGSFMYGGSDRGDLLNQSFDFPLDQGIDLGLMGDIGDQSFGTPEGAGNNEAQADEAFMEGPDMYIPDHSIVGNKRRADSDEVISEVEDVLETQKPRKAKQQKRIAFDASLELADEETTVDRYLERMEEEGKTLEIRQRNKADNEKTQYLVSGTAGLDFFNDDMTEFIQSVFKPSPFGWELEVAAHKTGQPLQKHRFTQEDVQFDQPLQEDVFGPIDLKQDYTGNDFITGRGVRDGSELLEVGRRVSEAGHHSALPWMESAMKNRGSVDLAGFDSSFTPGTLRLSMMTPQEMKIRLRGSIGGARSAKRPTRGPSMSSVMGGTDDGAMALIGDDDLELPGDDYHLNITESQAEQRSQFPEAYKPGLLASLETQCRVFLSTVESKMVEMGSDHLQFEDLAPATSSSRQAAVRAFYNCLTLVTKRMAAVEQHEPFGPIDIRLTA